MKPYLSVILGTNGGTSSLPLTLIDLDNCFSKLDITYEVLILGKSKEAQNISKKFSRVIKNVGFSLIDPDPSKISHLEINGSYGLLIKSASIPTIDCISSIVRSLDNDDSSKTSELVLGFHKKAGVSLINILGRIIGSPISLDA